MWKLQKPGCFLFFGSFANGFRNLTPVAICKLIPAVSGT